jgi:hypothetical protein
MEGYTMKQGIEMQLARLTAIQNELKTSLAHTETAINHFGQMEIPRGCAHILALQGHLAKVNDILTEIQIDHADHSKP